MKTSTCTRDLCEKDQLNANHVFPVKVDTRFKEQT